MIKIKIEIMKEYYNIFLNWKYCKRDNIDLSDGDTNLFPVLSIGNRYAEMELVWSTDLYDNTGNVVSTGN
ncbi:hypothetical protein [Bacteroides thetaiotaomicron]|jgi:hypothetical protein|uniref:Uncharacterized protein n=2 Tax=Bacteroides thetaiotaomicron TaxID=818 RepID=A0AAW4ZD62_BACT4|nr:hypothetical protein [Bacteroides thetaiotaomicron]MCE9240685.1 hypothetical protein [Bacteroides thetaiotaomicron]MCE9293807.1 hypothetical protein [Bacteroides thetaiotaomicron]